MNTESPLGKAPMLPLIVRMAVPPMFSMLLQSLYNIVDSIFVARLSSDALQAVSIIYPIQNLSLALAVGAGVGVNSYIARSLGAGDKEAAENAPAVSMVLTAVHYVLLAALSCLCIPAFVRMFTDDPAIRLHVPFLRVYRHGLLLRPALPYQRGKAFAGHGPHDGAPCDGADRLPYQCGAGSHHDLRPVGLPGPRRGGSRHRHRDRADRLRRRGRLAHRQGEMRPFL